MKAIRTILACLRRADNAYSLIHHGDKIVIGLSGGKDSVALTYALYLYQKFSHTDFVIQPVILDLGFPSFDPTPMQQFCASLGLNLIVSDNKEVYSILKIQQKDSPHLPCSICSRMKKAAINKVANDLGFNKVAFAHHIDDAIETLFMNEIYGGRIATFAPKMLLERADIEFIRPLIHVQEKDITRLIKEENLPVSSSGCPADKVTKREDIKQFLAQLYKKFPTAHENFDVMLTNFEKEDIWGEQLYYRINQNGLSLKPVISKDDMINVQNIRHEVFIKGQNIAIEDEFDVSLEKQATHFLIYLYEKPIGTIRYRHEEKGFKIERFAILENYRQKGFGKEVFIYLTNYLKAKYVPCTIYFSAQKYLIPFYEKLGFEKEGELFMEAGIEHLYMKKTFN